VRTIREIPPATQPELMDDLECSVSDLRGNLRDIECLNRLFGGHTVVRRYLDMILPVWRKQRSTRSSALAVLDVGTGGADIPAAVAEWGRRRQVPVRVVGVDRHSTIARIAKERAAAHQAVSVMLADATALPFRDASFDVCLCNLTLHHLARDHGIALLRRLHRLGRVGFLVVDLLRCPEGYGGAWLVTRLFRNPLTRHDGPLSIRRAMSWPEYRRFAADANIPGMQVSRLPFFRIALSRTGLAADPC
jgi:SAM-dependent methyltransferase